MRLPGARRRGRGARAQDEGGPAAARGHESQGRFARLDEIRKGVGQGSVAHPRLSVRREDAARCEAVLTPLVAEVGVLREDRSRPPCLVPLALLGCKVVVSERASGGAHAGSTYAIVQAAPLCGGPQLRRLALVEAMFGADAMAAGGALSLEEMKLPQLKEELAAREAKQTGLKASLQRQLHGLLVQAAIEARGEEAESEGDGDGGAASVAAPPCDAASGREEPRGCACAEPEALRCGVYVCVFACFQSG